MSNPFQRLKDRRDAESEAKLREKRAREQTELRKRQRNLDRLQAAERLDEMVVDVLEKLRQAAYPNLKIKTSPKLDGSYQDRYLGADDLAVCWSIGYVYRDRYREWLRVASVTLTYDERNRPSHFRCYSECAYDAWWWSWHKESNWLDLVRSAMRSEPSPPKQGVVLCGVSREELVEALRFLHTWYSP